MKKNTILLIGGLAAAYFIFVAMRRRRGSSVEAGPTEKITAEQFESAEVIETAPAVKPMQPKTVIDVIKSLKRAPEKKAAAQKRKALKKQPKTAAAVKSFLKMPRAIKGMDNISVLY